MAISASATRPSSATRNTARISSAKLARLLALAFGEAPGEQRHEGGVEGALAEQAAEQVGKAEGDDEGVGDRPGAQSRRHEHVAHEAEDPARHGEPADGGEDRMRDMAVRPRRFSVTPARGRSARDASLRRMTQENWQTNPGSQFCRRLAGGRIPARGETFASFRRFGMRGAGRRSGGRWMAAAGDLLGAGQVGDVEGVDGLLAEGGDVGRADVEVEPRQRLR
jgi:hypothetical protein